jgi:hypothetical protein
VDALALSLGSEFLFSADINRVYDALDLPVWLAHGVRGDFTDYSGTSKLARARTGSCASFRPADYLTSSSRMSSSRPMTGSWSAPARRARAARACRSCLQ